AVRAAGAEVGRGVRDAGEMHDRVDVGEQGPPFERAGKVGDRDDLDRTRKDVGGLPHRGAHAVALRRQVLDHGSPDKPPSPGHQDAHQVFLPRAKLASSTPTRATPAASATAETPPLGTTTVIRASAPSPILTRKTRNTIVLTLRPRSVARW